ncbi:MAG: hypothetical protein ABSE49_22850 [Polyangiaceae bacterium]|jgi:hypothetical protein
MSRVHSISLSALVLAVAVPFAWLACGGGKPPETPADESSSNADGGDTTATTDKGASSASPASSSAGDDSSSSAAPAASATAAAPPPPPALSDTDCGKCIDKTCAKAEAACGKNTDCQSMLDGVHACTTAAGGCIANASMPPSGKPKKLAGGFAACAKKAVSGKACKAKCQ